MPDFHNVVCFCSSVQAGRLCQLVLLPASEQTMKLNLHIETVCSAMLLFGFESIHFFVFVSFNVTVSSSGAQWNELERMWKLHVWPAIPVFACRD
jgi:hypothetical protein